MSLVKVVRYVKYNFALLPCYFRYHCESEYCDRGVYTPPHCKIPLRNCSTLLASYTANNITSIISVIKNLKLDVQVIIIFIPTIRFSFYYCGVRKVSFIIRCGGVLEGFVIKNEMYYTKLIN